MDVAILNTFLRPILTVDLVWNNKKLVTCKIPLSSLALNKSANPEPCYLHIKLVFTPKEFVAAQRVIIIKFILVKYLVCSEIKTAKTNSRPSLKSLNLISEKFHKKLN